MNNKIETTAPDLRPKSRLSMIWILPLLALMIGAGLVYQNWLNRGIVIEVTFDTAEGLEAGKTKIKNRNVDIGMVTSIRFNEQRSAIVTEIEMINNMRDFLRSDSEFWVVRPQVGASGITGMDTLLTGAYIEIAPGKNTDYATEFTGLESPPISKPNAEGIQLMLTSTGGKPLNIGNPVLYRGFDVGAVESVQFDPLTRLAEYSIFVESPYDALITTNTFFWNASGMSISTSATGLKVDFNSLESIVTGGVEFDVPNDLELGERIRNQRTFKLYDTKESIIEDREYEHLAFILLVDNSVSGLNKGAPVEYRGVRIGSVEDPFLDFDQTREIAEQTVAIPVLIHIEPRRFAKNSAYDMQWFEDQLDQWILSGIRAKTDPANLLTGTLKVSLIPTNNPISKISYFGPYKVIPFQRGAFNSLTEQVNSLISKLDTLPLEETIANTNKVLNKLDSLPLESTLQATNQVLGSADEAFGRFNKTLTELEDTLNGLQPDSSLYQSLEQSLSELQSTLKEIQPLVREISNKPSSLIFSDPDKPDSEPKGKNQP